MFLKIIIGYWIISTILGLYWMIKHPEEPYDDKEYFTLAEVFSNILPCAVVCWALLPIVVLGLIKFKR